MTSGLNKNVVFISHYNAMNGANQSLLALIKHIREKVNIKGIFVHNPSRKKEGFYLELTKLNLPVENVSIPSFLYYRRPFLGIILLPIKLLIALPAILRMLRFVKRQNVQLIYSNSSVESSGVFIAKLMEVEHIWHIREFGYQDYKLKHIGGEWLKRKVLNMSTNIIAISNSIASYINLSKTTQVYNPVYDETDGFDKGEYKFSNENIVRLGVVGLIGETKNQLRALMALARLKESGFKLNVVFWGDIGQYDYKKRLLDFIKENELQDLVFFKSFECDKRKIYRSFDILIMCSLNEAFGRVTVEAMLHEVPVVGFDSAGTKELVRNGINGLLYDDCNVSLEDQLRSLIERPVLAQKIAVAGRNFAENFSIERHVSTIADIISGAK